MKLLKYDQIRAFEQAGSFTTIFYGFKRFFMVLYDYDNFCGKDST